jgi:Bacterial antitoxin of type II TA system, VapB
MTAKRTHKHFQLDSAKIKRAQRAMRAKTQTEAIDRALDLVIEEHSSNRMVGLEDGADLSEQVEAFRRTGHHHRDSYRELAKGE